MNNHLLHRFFNPQSVAIVGATRNPFSNNFNLINNLVKLGYAGRIYAINPKEESIGGIKCYKSVNDIDDYIDLVAISVPARNVLEVVKGLDGKKVGGVVLISGGFSEIGGEGQKVQSEIAAILKQKGIRAIGPNALSPINSHANFTISFADVLKLPRGNVSFIFQSGMYEPRFNWMVSDFHLKISKLIDLGNKMDLTEVDALEYLVHDELTEAIFIHLEAVKGDGRRFFQLLKEAARIKPVVVLKGGRSEAGAKAALSHTGSLARANDVIFDTALKQAGVIRADTLDDFLYLAKAFGYLPLPTGNRIALATFPGGEAVLATDICSQQGLIMAKPGRNAYEKLKELFPAWEINLNPFDFGVVYTFHLLQNNHASFIEAMAEDENVDFIAVELPPNFFPVKAEDLCAPFTIAQEKGKPLAGWALAMLKFDGEITDYLEERSIPVFPSAAITIRCLGALNRYRMWRESLKP
jgi:acyl-CoA synthetase (NDP forming)